MTSIKKDEFKDIVISADEIIAIKQLPISEAMKTLRSISEQRGIDYQFKIKISKNKSVKDAFLGIHTRFEKDGSFVQRNVWV